MAVEFRGSARRFAFRSAGYLALTSGVGSYVLLGDGWPRFFLFSFLICAVPIGGLCLLLLWIDRITFDDDAGVIRRPLRRPIPYDAAGGFHVHNAGGLASLTTAKRGPILLFSFDPADGARLEAEMSQRRPEALFRRSGSSSLWLLATLVGLPLVIGAAYSWSLSKNFDGLREPCTTTDWRIESAGPREQQLGAFAIGIPAGFVPSPGDKMAYRSSSSEIVYGLQHGMRDAFVGVILRYGIGVDGSAAMIRWGACATQGILPLTAKTSLFGAESTERLLFAGGIAVLRQYADHGSALLAVEGPDGTDLIVDVDFEGKIDTQLLERVISLVGIGPQRLARRSD